MIDGVAWMLNTFALKGQKKMQEGARNTLCDELEVEIADLDVGDAWTSRRKRARKRLTKRQRRLGTMLTVVVYVLTLGLLVGSLSGISARVWHRLFPAQANSARTVPFYLVGNPSWGHFAINGQFVVHLPVVGQDRPLALPPGTYTIGWQAAPFQPQSCTLHLTLTQTPAASSSCALRRTFSGEKAARIPVVDFFASLNDLLPAQRATVLQQTRAILAEQAEQATVQPGEWYARSPQEPGVSSPLCRSAVIGSLCAAQATQPLQATLHLQMDVGNQQTGQCFLAFCQGQPGCRFFCANPNMSPGAQGWNVEVLAHGYWTYTPLSDQLPRQTQSLSFASVAPTSQFTSLYLTWERNRWQVMLLDAPGMIDTPERNPICLQAQQDLKQVITLSNQRVALVQIVGDSASNPADGCLVAFRPGDRLSGSEQTAYCFERFGVLLAANTLARRIWPYLPLVNAQERLLVERFEPPALAFAPGLG
jgi:hypothetical protein